METRTLQVNPEDAGGRLDAWLAGQLPDVTRSAAARLCEEGRVTLAGRPLAKNYRLNGERPWPSPCRTRSRWTWRPRTSPWTWCTRTLTSSW